MYYLNKLYFLRPDDNEMDLMITSTTNHEKRGLLVPNLQRLAADRVQDGQESGLVGVLEHRTLASIPLGSV